MKKRLPFYGNRCVPFILALCWSLASIGQVSITDGIYEAGFSFSPSNFLGDLGGNYGKGGPFLKDNQISNTKVLTALHVTVYPNELYGFRLSFTTGTIGGDDANIEGKGGLEEARKARNLNFKSKISELFAAAEIYPTVLLEQDASDISHKFRPFLVAGIGVFKFNPQGLDPATGEWVYLKPLRTEGQGFTEHPDRKEYKLIQLNIPVGFGIKYFLNEDVNLTLEFTTRKTFTDYIDDVSTTYIDKDLFYNYLPLDAAILANRMYDKTAGALNRNISESKRGNPGNKDSYYSAGLKMSFRLNGGTESKGNRGSMKCPNIKLF